MRPTNLDWQPPADLTTGLEIMTADVESPASVVAARLFDLDGWRDRAVELLGALASAPELKDRLAIAAAVVRHLTLDPLLPAAVLPEAWPAGDLSTAYRRFRAQLLAARTPSR